MNSYNYDHKYEKRLHVVDELAEANVTSNGFSAECHMVLDGIAKGC